MSFSATYGSQDKAPLSLFPIEKYKQAIEYYIPKTSVNYNKPLISKKMASAHF